jgi:lipopolysaccharide export system permease protein
MAAASILSRYVVRQILGPLGLSVGMLTVLFVMAEMVKITNWIVNYGIGMGRVLALLALMMPSFLVFIIPMSLLLGVVLTFLRMSSDNEVIAVKSSGASITRFLPPVMLLAAAACGLTLFLTLAAVPWGRAALADLAYRVVTDRIDLALKEKVFNDTLDRVVVYVGSVDPKARRWTNVFIEDRRDPRAVNTVVAPEGRLLSEPGQKELRLLLVNGTIHQTRLAEGRAQAVRFTTYQLVFDLKASPVFNPQRSKSIKELRLAELEEELAALPPDHPRRYKIRTLIHRMFAIPAACFSLALLGLPLGIQARRARRSFGLALSLAAILLYYLLLTAGYALSEKGLVPPAAAMWLPNLVIAALGAYLLVQTVRERPSRILRIAARVPGARRLLGGGGGP